MSDEMNLTPPTAAAKQSPYCTNLKDITGQKFGRLTVLRREGKNISGQATWRCRCDCDGNESALVAGSTLRAGIVVSCGCYGKEARAAATTTHGDSNTTFYKSFTSMHGRMQPTHPKAKNYFERGIKICDRWMSYDPFKEDMFAKYEDAQKENLGKVMTLERRDVNGDYCPENCYFATMKVQNNNKRNNVRHDHGGENLTSAQWAERAGISLPLFRLRYHKYNWSMERILSTPAYHTAAYKAAHNLPA